MHLNMNVVCKIIVHQRFEIFSSLQKNSEILELWPIEI